MNGSTKLVLLTTLLTLSIGLSAASPADMSIFPKESSSRIDSFTSYEVTVENTGPVMDEYSLSSSNPDVISIAPRDVKLSPGEKEVVNVWYNPSTNMEAGQYSFNIEATSRATGKDYTVQGIVNVIKEHEVSMQVADAGPACLGERATYNVQVTNGGIQKETFELTSPVGEFSQKKVTLEDGETATVKLYASSNEAAEKTFNVVAASTTSYAQSISSVTFKAEVCYQSDVVISPETQRTAAKTTAEFDVTVRNTGTKADTFTLQTNQGNLADSSLQINAGSSKSTTVKYTPQQLGQQTVTVTAKSEVTSSQSATVTVYNGMSSELTLAKKAVNTCENTVETTEITVKNTGEANETFSLSTNTGELSTEDVTLGTGQSKTVELGVNTSNYQTGSTVNYQVTSTAKTFDSPSTSKQGSFQINNCWDIDMQIIPEVASAGENMSQVYEVRLKNTGTKANTYELTYEGPSWVSIRDRESDDNQQTVTVQPGETGFADIYAGIPFQKKGEVEITATAVGEQVKESKTVKLVVGKDIKEAMESDETQAGSITGSFSQAASDIVKQVQGQNSLGRAAIAIILGLLLTAGILYIER